MEAQFVDRLLTCVDCRSEFVFTAGEQLFFYDKQFKNDPKRCKPCKSRRSGLTAAANGTGPVAAGISRTETRTECSDCGVQTTVPFKPTQGRPVLCRQCFQVKSKNVGVPVAAAAVAAATVAAATIAAATIAAATIAAATGTPPGEMVAAGVVTPTLNPAIVEAAPDLMNLTSALVEPTTTSETVTALTAASADKNGRVLSLEAAQLAVATMAAASPASSVATMADLASILSAAEPLAGRGSKPNGAIPQLLAAAQSEGAGTAVALAADAPEGSE